MLIATIFLLIDVIIGHNAININKEILNKKGNDPHGQLPKYTNLA